MTKYARKCDVTGRGMNEGWVWGEGTYYTSTKEVTIAELRSDIQDGAYDFDEVGADALLKLLDDSNTTPNGKKLMTTYTTTQKVTNMNFKKLETMKPINHVAFQWTADDIERHIENLSSNDQVMAESRIDSYKEFLENVIEENKYEIMELINELIIKAIYNEIR
jgi:hypothetical protein